MAGCATTPPEEDPVHIKLNDLDTRLTRVERVISNQSLLDMANQVHGILILDIQVGLSNVQTEIPLLKQWLQQPNVEIAIDPEFSMKDKTPPGKEIGVDGLVRVGVQSAIAHPETGLLLRKLMIAAGLPAPPVGRTLDSICITDACD